MQLYVKGILFIALCCLVHLSAQGQTTDSAQLNAKFKSGDVNVATTDGEENDTLISDPIKTDSFGAVEGMFSGGESEFFKFFSENFQYPSRCLDEGISGSVKLRFVLDTKGRISKISAEEETTSCTEFTQEAIRVLKISSGKWIPALKNGKAVSSWKVLPIRLMVE